MIPGTQRIRSQPWAADIQNHPPDPGSAVSDLVSRRHHCWSGQHQREGDCGACWERWVRLEFNGKISLNEGLCHVSPISSVSTCTIEVNTWSQIRQFDSFQAVINLNVNSCLLFCFIYSAIMSKLCNCLIRQITQVSTGSFCHSDALFSSFSFFLSWWMML